MANTLPIRTSSITKDVPRLTMDVSIPVENTDVRYQTYVRKSLVAHRYMKEIKTGLTEFLKDMRVLMNQSPSKDMTIDVTMVDSNKSAIFTNYKGIKRDKGDLGYFQPQFNVSQNKYTHLLNSRVVISMYTLSSLVHECGHMLDNAYGYEPRLSDRADFRPFYDEYINALEIIKDSDVFTYKPADEYMWYLKDPSEVFARSFQTWYCHVIQPTKSNPDLFGDLTNDAYFGIGEAASEFLFNTKPELYNYFDKYYGRVLENEKAIELAKALGTLDTTPIFQH